jgi:hypothetical protein
MTLNYTVYKNCDTTFADRFCDYKNLFNASREGSSGNVYSSPVECSTTFTVNSYKAFGAMWCIHLQEF